MYALLVGSIHKKGGKVFLPPSALLKLKLVQTTFWLLLLVTNFSAATHQVYKMDFPGKTGIFRERPKQAPTMVHELRFPYGKS